MNFAGSATFVSPAVPLYGRGVGWRLATLGLTGYLVLLRLVYLRLPNLMPEETYYWNYGQHLAPGYLDHPPMVAWLGRLGTSLFGQNEFGVRIGPFVCWIIASLFCFGLARRMFGKTTGFVAVLLFQALPFFFSLGLILTPDAPLVACWSAMLFYLYRALVEEEPAAWWGVGVALGFGMLSKYSIALLGHRDVLLPRAGCALATLVSQPATVSRRRVGRADFLAGHLLERDARLGVICVSKLAPARGEDAICAAHPGGIGLRIARADRRGGGGNGALDELVAGEGNPPSIRRARAPGSLR